MEDDRREFMNITLRWIAILKETDAVEKLQYLGIYKLQECSTPQFFVI